MTDQEKIKIIKESESSPKVINNIYSDIEIKEFMQLYKDLPTTVHNKKQNVIKKRWLQGYSKNLEKIFCERLRNEIGDFKMDNLKTEEGKDIYGLIQESYAPIGLHVDGGFNLENIIFKQSLIPLTPVGTTNFLRFVSLSTALPFVSTTSAKPTPASAPVK